MLQQYVLINQTASDSGVRTNVCVIKGDLREFLQNRYTVEFPAKI